MGDTTLWSVTAATNASADPSINWAEGQAPGTVNDSARATMAALAQRWLDEAAYVASGGSSTAYTVTPQQTITAYREGLTIGFRAHTACGATPTLNVSALGAKALRNRANGTLAANEIASGAYVRAVYSASLDTFLIMNQPVSTELDVLIAALGYTTFPVGFVADYAGSTAPSKWLFSYGQAVSRTTYASLFSALGTTYGSGNGSTTFNLPDYRGRVIAGRDDMGGSSASRLTGSYFGGSSNQLGAVGGLESNTLTRAQLPNFSPTYTGSPQNVNIEVTSTASNVVRGTVVASVDLEAAGVNDIDAIAENTGSSGSITSSGTNAIPSVGTIEAIGADAPHNNVQPTIIANKIIYTGVA